MKKIFLAAVASTALVSAAQAATIIQTVNFSNQLTDFSKQGSFALFDSTLGTLTSVTFSTTYNFNTTITVTNNGPSDATGSAYTGSVLQATSNNATINAILNSLYNTNTTTAPGGATFKYGAGATTGVYDPGTGQVSGQDYSIAGGSGNSQTLDPVSSTNGVKNVTLANISNGNLNAFTQQAAGISTAFLIASTLTSTTNTVTGGNSSASQQTLANSGFTITYNYTAAAAAVPEPATWAMMIGGFGLVGFGLRRRGTSVVFN